MRRSNIDITFVIIMVLLLGNSLRSGGFSNPQEWIMSKILILPAVIIGISFHEFAHGFAAYKLGDITPKLQGRVTLNPMAHIDWLGLAALFFCGFGWGRPVEINPYNFKKVRRDEFIVAIAGVLMNLLLAVVFTIVAKIIVSVPGGVELVTGSVLGDGLWQIIYYIVQINIVLMIFNLIPCPPLDGFNIVAQIGGFGQSETYWRMYNIGNFVLIGLIVFGITSKILVPCVEFFMNIFWTVVL